MMRRRRTWSVRMKMRLRLELISRIIAHISIVKQPATFFKEMGGTLLERVEQMMQMRMMRVKKMIQRMIQQVQILVNMTMRLNTMRMTTAMRTRKKLMMEKCGQKAKYLLL